jgi:hypothetical protein
MSSLLNIGFTDRVTSDEKQKITEAIHKYIGMTQAVPINEATVKVDVADKDEATFCQNREDCWVTFDKKEVGAEKVVREISRVLQQPKKTVSSRVYFLLIFGIISFLLGVALFSYTMYRIFHGRV